MPSASEPAITVRDLAIGFNGVAIQEKLTFEVQRGDVFVILGGSGCGKSTLLRHLIGLDEPIRGDIKLSVPPRTSVAWGPLGEPPPFGVMFQAGALFSSLTLLQNISLPLRRWTQLDNESIEAIALARLRLVGLGSFENHLPADISGGMKKRAAIARALALDPPLVFLDEPSAGLDPITAVELDDLIAEMRDHLGVTTVMVTHELASIFRVATSCIMLDRDARGIIARGDPRVLRDDSTDPRVQRFFRRQPART